MRFARYRMAFRPEGQTPRMREFSCMSFESWEQIADYLDILQKPLRVLPWVMDGEALISPVEVIARVADLTAANELSNAASVAAT